MNTQLENRNAQIQITMAHSTHWLKYKYSIYLHMQDGLVQTDYMLSFDKKRLQILVIISYHHASAVKVI